jgi:hypothetical protein
MDGSLLLTLSGKSLGGMAEPVSDEFFQVSSRRATVTLLTQDGICKKNK